MYFKVFLLLVFCLPLNRLEYLVQFCAALDVSLLVININELCSLMVLFMTSVKSDENLVSGCFYCAIWQ